MPMIKGKEAIGKTFTEMMKMPGFSLSWTAAKADVAASGDIGHTAGTYEMVMGGTTEKGKYFTAWKKVNGAWKVTDDIFNSDGAPAAPADAHVMMPANALKWGDSPPGLPAGAHAAVVSGDPGKAEPYVLRAQLPANYRIPPHWHPTTENITVLSAQSRWAMATRSTNRRCRPFPLEDSEQCPQHAPLLHGENRRDYSGARDGAVRHHICECEGRSEDEEQLEASERRGGQGPRGACVLW